MLRFKLLPHICGISLQGFLFVVFTTRGILRTRECVYVILELLWFSHRILNTGILFCMMELKNLPEIYFRGKRHVFCTLKVSKY